MNTQKNEIVVIVNAYLSGAYLAPEFLKNGYQCIHVTTEAYWKNQKYQDSFRKNDFIKTIIMKSEDSIDLAQCELQNYNIKIIISGTESGVSLADKMAHNFNLDINDYETASARRNKFEMQEILKKNNLRSIFQIKTSLVEEVLQWKQRHNLKRIVLKPLCSAASDSVFYCDNESEIREAFSYIKNKKDIFGNDNHEVLSQEYIDGDEYIVNTVTCNKKHIFVDIWKGRSLDKNIVSNDIYADMVHPSGSDYQLICNYISKVLDALGIKSGPAHSEVRIDKNGVCCLIEVGSRLAGRVDFDAVEEIYGCSQLSISILAFIKPEEFLRIKDYYITPKKYARYVYFFSAEEGVIINEVDTQDFHILKTVFSVRIFLEKNGMLNKTCKSIGVTRPGYAYLISDNMHDIEKDFPLFKSIEKNFYNKLIGK